MFNRVKNQSEIPFDATVSPKMIPWIIALMVYLATVALSSAVSVNRFIEQWTQDLDHGFTVELDSHENNDAEALADEIQRQKLALEILKSLPGVTHIEVVEKSAMMGSREKSKPTLVEVHLGPKARLDLSALEIELEDVLPGTVIKDRLEGREGLIQLAQSALMGAIFIACLIGAAAVITISFATHTGLVIHQRIIDTLRLIGAQDKFIATQFQRHAFSLATKGGMIGVSLSALTFLALQYFGTERILTPEIWLVILITPMLMAVITMLSARMTVMLSMDTEESFHGFGAA